MSQTVTTGQRTTHGAQSALIPTLFVDKALAVITGSAMGFSFVAKLKKSKSIGTLQPKVGEDLLLKNWTTVATAYAAGATSIVFASGTGQYAASRDIIYNKTAGGGRHMCVSLSTDTWTVWANVDSGTSTAGAVGDELMILSAYIEQGGPYPRAKTVTEVQRTHYLHTHSTSIEFSEEAENADSYFTPKDYPYQKNKLFFIEHVKQREYKALWGMKGRAVALSTLGTYTDLDPDGAAAANQVQFGWGFFPWMDSVADADHILTDTDLTEPEMTKNFEMMFFAEQEPQHIENVLVFYPKELATGISLWNMGRVRFNAKMGTGANLGLTWNEWDSPFGTIKLKLMEHLSARVAGGINRYFSVDTRFLTWQPYNGMDTRVKQNVVQDGYHRRIDEITETGAVIFKQPNAHCVGKFITTS